MRVAFTFALIFWVSFFLAMQGCNATDAALVAAATPPTISAIEAWLASLQAHMDPVQFAELKLAVSKVGTVVGALSEGVTVLFDAMRELRKPPDPEGLSTSETAIIAGLSGVTGAAFGRFRKKPAPGAPGA